MAHLHTRSVLRLTAFSIGQELSNICINCLALSPGGIRPFASQYNYIAVLAVELWRFRDAMKINSSKWWNLLGFYEFSCIISNISSQFSADLPRSLDIVVPVRQRYIAYTSSAILFVHLFLYSCFVFCSFFGGGGVIPSPFRFAYHLQIWVQSQR